MSYGLESIIHRIVGDQTLHARWLNSFSYLEYIGFRKIVKSQAANFMSSETLNHAVEEGRHALLLKKISIKFGGAKFDSYAPETMLCADQATYYFQELECGCDKIFLQSSAPNRSRLVYLCVTWLIELRALSIYTLYQKVTENLGIKTPIAGLLSEEGRHLDAVEGELRRTIPNFENRLNDMKVLEENLYREFFFAISRELGMNNGELIAHA